MFCGQKSVFWVIFYFLSASFLLGCSSDPSSQVQNADSTSFQLPDSLEALRLSDNGNVRAYVQVDNDTKRELTINGNTASIDLTVAEGTHDFTLILEYILTSDPNNPVTIAEVTKQGTVSASGSTPVSFSNADFEAVYSNYDDDNDGISNFSEMQSGDSAPVATAVTPTDGNADVVANTTIEITFDDPMIASTLTTSSFTLSGASVGTVAGAVSYDDTNNTATFTPNQVLRAYETYTATVTTDAQNTASIALAANETWSFTIQEPPVQQISAVRTSGATTTPIMVFNDAGEGIAVWEVSNIGRSLVYSYFDGSSWSTEAILASITSNNSMQPQLVSNGTNFALVWREFDGSYFQLYSSFYDTDWSTPDIIDDTNEDTSANNQRLASNGTGYAVTWRQEQATQNRIYARISTDGSSWGSAVVIDDASTGALNPRIASNGTDYAVIWQQDSPNRIGVNVYSGSWSSATAALLDNSSTYSASYHDIASNGSGYSVIWSKYDGTRQNVLNRTYYNSGGFSWSAQTDIDGNTNNSYIQYENNAITSNGTGYAVALQRYNGSTYDAYAVINAAGDDSWGTPASLESESNNINGAPIIASNGSTYATLWSQYNGSSTYDLFSSVYNGTSWSGGAAIEAASSPVYGSFKLANLGTKYIATWYQQVSGINDIFANVYDSGWGLVSQLDAGTNSTSSPSIASDPTGNIIVGWSETGSGVYSNTYDNSSWSTQVALTTTAFGGSSYSPRLLNNGNGRTLAIWRQYSGNNYNLYANIHENGAWGTPQVLSDQNPYSGNIHTATDGAGFAVAWVEYDGTQESVFARVYDGTSWTAKEEVDDSAIDGYAYIASSANGLDTALASNGSGYMLVYYQYDGSTYTDVYARHFDGTSWGAPEVLDLPAINYSVSSPYIATNGSSYVAFWPQYDGTASRLYSSEFDGSSWSTAQNLENSGNGFYYYPTKLVSNGTDYLAVWSQTDGTQYRVYASFLSSGSWSTPAPLDPGTASHQVYSKPQAVFSSGNSYAAVWQEYTGSVYEINVATYDGTTWVAATTVDDGTAGSTAFDSYSYNHIASNGSDYAVIWRRYDGSSTYDLYASDFDGTSWSSAELLETGAEYVNFAQIASNGDGFLVAWQQDDGTGLFDIVSNRFVPGSGWAGETILDEDSNNSAFDLTLTGTVDGYLGTWTQPEPTGDPAVRFPWSKILF